MDNMKMHIGTKLLLAVAMTLQEYNDYRGWDIPDDEDGSAEGCLVEYQDGGKPNHPDHKGYISWSPKEAFDNSYQDVEVGMSFGSAIELLKRTCKVARRGWNGNGMWLRLQVPDEHSKMTQPYVYFNVPDCEEGMRRIPYVCTTIDMLANDWVVVD